jgi:DeoR/GlpR family transcriptional regulator of sugar metabolism
VGSLAESTFKQINVGTAIVGCDGLSVDGGLTTHDDVEAATNHTMIERAPRIIAVADGSKIGRVTLARLADVTDIDLLVTDDTADPEQIEGIRARGVQVKLVQAPQE